MLSVYGVVWIATAVALFVALVIGVVQRVRGRADGMNDLEGMARRTRWTFAGLIVALAAASLTYKQLVYHRLEQTSALFIGLPALLAVLVIFATRPKSATGMLCKATAIALLISGIFLGEGFICILMAAPLFFGVAVLLGGIVDSLKSEERSQTRMTCLVLVALVPMSLEGVRPGLSFPREEAITVERVLPLSAAEVERNLAATPRFDGALPAYLRLGFPRPAGATGDGLQPRSRRGVHFAGGEGKPGDLAIEVAESSPGRVVFVMNSDSSHVAHWMTWESAIVSWREESPGTTRVQWTTHYRRSLDPAWYFGPWERYAVRLANGYLIDNLAAGSVR